MVKSFKELRIRTDNFSPSDSVLFDYLNELGHGKGPIVMKALKAFFYPEISYEQGLLDRDTREINQALCILEARLHYLRQLTGSDVKHITDALVSQVSLPLSTLTNPICQYGDDDSIDDSINIPSSKDKSDDLDEIDDSVADFYNDGL